MAPIRIPKPDKLLGSPPVKSKFLAVVDAPRSRYPDDVLTNLRRFTTTIAIECPGRHTLTAWMVGSYLGPPESLHATPNW